MSVKIKVINSGLFKLDGGAMFGVVPQAIWKNLNPPDDNNMCTWALRCLLVEDGDRKILIDTGMGDKQDDKFRSHFYPHGSTLLNSLKENGVTPDEITDVLLTHLHFDHCGGALYRDNDQIKTTFPNAVYWSNASHYQWAITPNYREKASFLPENIKPLKDLGQLDFIEEKDGVRFSDNITIKFAYGHTEAMMFPHIHLDNANVLIYTADLLASSFHVRMPYVMSYDIRPLVTLAEKKALYAEAVADNQYFFFEHDPINPIGKLRKDSKGRYMCQTDIGLGEIV